MKATDSEKAKRYEEQAIHAEQLVANADVVGSCKGKPVSTFKIRHSETILDEIEKHGRSVGSCGHHTQLCADFMRALGIAPIRFAVVASREDLTDHTWPGRYDPSGKVWRAYQAGRQGKAWWFFFLPRLPVFSYATETEQIKMNKTYQGPRPSPQFFCRELQGFQVKAISQDGIPTEEVREWMLTSGF
jgi:hypothetical protein